MDLEVQVALNFLISFLYNKLPRRRVNQLGEELERAFKLKFQGHWYPDKPFKGQAFRCVKTAPPLDPAFEHAAHVSGMDVNDIQDNLPKDLSIWIDPGEVSYKLGEKGTTKILYSVLDNSEENADREICRTFNPEAQCFKPIDSVTSQLGSLSVSGSATSSPFSSSPSPTYKSTSPVNNGFTQKTTTPLTFTTATFAQTKFGSTKLKTNSKRSHRMSPTEFSSYIKQRALVQQQQQSQQPQPNPHQQSAAAAAAIFAAAAANATATPPRPRSLSPNPHQQLDPNFLLLATNSQQQQQQQQQFPNQSSRSFGSSFDGVNGYLGDFFTPSSVNAAAAAAATAVVATSKINQQQGQRPAANMAANSSPLSLLFEKPILNGSNSVGGLNFNIGETSNKSFGFDSVNFNINAMSYPNQYHHLLVAN